MNKEKTLEKICKLIKNGEEVLSTLIDRSQDCSDTSHSIICFAPFSGIYVDDDKFKSWQSKIRAFLLSNEIFNNSYEEFNKDSEFWTNHDYSKHYMNVLETLKENIEDDTIKLIERDSINKFEQQCIFIGHGHSNLWNEVVRMLKDDYHLADCINYFEKDSQVGRFIGEALNDFHNEATFAIIIMTAEDETATGELRARQNVVHEIGFFQGKLGFNKVAILKQKEVKSFTNIDGLQYIEFSGNDISQTFYALQKMLKREGIVK